MTYMHKGMDIIYSKGFTGTEWSEKGYKILKVKKQLILQDGHFAEILVNSNTYTVLKYKKLKTFSSFQKSLEGFGVNDRWIKDPEIGMDIEILNLQHLNIDTWV